jgi:hypothetical protein
MPSRQRQPLSPPSFHLALPLAALLAQCMALLLASVAPARAQDATERPASARSRAAEVSARTVEQKLQMVDRLLFNSPVAARVSSSQNEEARRHLLNARELSTHGRALAGTGQLRGADALLNEATWEIGRAQQLVPDQAARLVDERARFDQLSGSVAALLRTYQLGVSGQGVITLRPEATAERNVTRAMAAVDQARAQADAGQLPEANRTLDQALSLLLKDALHRLDGQTLVYDRRFASTRDEFAYELARHRSLDGLVPLAVLEYRPSREAQVLIDRYVKQARDHRARAESQAGAADHANALLSLSEGTESLQRALQAAGLSVPQTMGSQ